MAKTVVKATKSYREGHISLSVKADAHHVGTSVASTVSVSLDIEAALNLRADIMAAVDKELASIKTRQERETRRKAWRDREVAAGRLQIFPLSALTR